ncbi:MFS multidrug transporter [Phyllosticta citriasiana]|uniref:MFS multidrug transporter n=1 Tax=Phyllosticta citriasiana TaxID=595635 RepID=A0ABR1KGR3_9PEZI
MAAGPSSMEKTTRPTESPERVNPPQSPESERNSMDSIEESAEARLERLGRQRPEVFRSKWEEIGFIYSVTMSQMLTEYFVSGFSVILPTVSRELNIPDSSSTWPMNAFSLVVACFLLIFGRLGDIYGGFPVYVGGIIWFTLWSFICGWSQNELMMDFCRALQGLGPAAYLPTGLMLLGSFYRPGPRKNIVFSLYGAMAPLGFFVGIFFAGVTAQYTTWRWYFFIGTILSLSTVVVAYFAIPSDSQTRKNLGVKMDWWGALLSSVGLILLVFAITDSSSAPNGWATPYIPALLAVGILVLVACVYVEGWVSEQPLLPFDIFKVKYMSPLCIALLFQYGSFGIFLLYATFYMEKIMGANPLQVTAWFAPMAVGGIIISTVGGMVLHHLPGTVLILVSGVAFTISPLLFALAPAGANYWAWVFPAMICATIGIDVTFNVANIFITTAMPLRRQGLAGALINSLVQLAIAVFLGWADVAAANTEHRGRRESYKIVFWFELACAAVGLVILALFVKIRPATSELTADEKAELAAEEAEVMRRSREEPVGVQT